MTPLPKALQRLPLSRMLVLLFLLVIIGLGAVPGYLKGGHWSWQQPLTVATLKQLKSIRQTGVNVPGWRSVTQKEVTIGGHKWSLQEIAPQSADPTNTDPKAMLLLLPQDSNKSQPQVEWTDISSAQRWQQDSEQRLKFIARVPSSASQPAIQPVEANFFRAWNQRQTYAVVQWYAWTTGGHPAPSHWYWADRLTQLQRSRLPWVAVAILIPIEPLGDIETARPQAEALGRSVQTALMQGALQG